MNEHDHSVLRAKENMPDMFRRRAIVVFPSTYQQVKHSKPLIKIQYLEVQHHNTIILPFPCHRIEFSAEFALQ